MKRLTVHYDAACAFCVRCRAWLEKQPKFVPLEFRRAETREELVVVSDEGGVYRGPDAFIMCLWALVDYREWAIRLATPALKPFARRVFEWLSENRGTLSKWLATAGERPQSRTAIRASPSPPAV